MKRRINHAVKAYQKGNKSKQGMYVLDCRNHPSRVTAFGCHPQDLYGASVDVESLIDGRPNSCSFFHCGIEVITQKEAFEMRDYAKEHGVRQYMIDKIGYTEDDSEEHPDYLDKE